MIKAIKNNKFNVALGVVFSLSFFIIFYNLGKEPLGHYREELNENAPEYNLKWEVLDNPIFAGVMHYKYLNYHEYRYTTIAQKIVETGNWQNLEVKNLGQDMPYYHKGPVYFWLTAILGKIFGFSAFISRFWPALFGFGVIALTYLISREIFSRSVGILSVIILATSFQYIHVDGARSASIDTIFIFFVLLAFYAFLNRERNSKFFYLAIISIIIASLTRSIFLVFALLPAFVFIDLIVSGTGNWKKTLLRWTLSSMIILIAVGSWAGLQYAKEGQGYFTEIWNSQIRDEFFNKIKFANPEMYLNFQYSLLAVERPSDFMFYPCVILKGFFPWSIFVPISFIYFILKAFLSKNKKIIAFLLATLLIASLILFKEQNWARYANNLYPFFSIMLAIFSYDFLKKRGSSFTYWVFLLTLGVFSFVIFPFKFNMQVFSVIASLVIIFSGAAHIFWRKYFPRWGNITAFVLFGYFLAIAIVNVLRPYF